MGLLDLFQGDRQRSEVVPVERRKTIMGIGTSPSDQYFLRYLPKIMQYVMPGRIREPDPRVGEPFMLASKLAADVLGDNPDKKAHVQALTEIRGRLANLTKELDAEISQLKKQIALGS
jgi:hypothetical protein